jgi:hypothetical protein
MLIEDDDVDEALSRPCRWIKCRCSKYLDQVGSAAGVGRVTAELQHYSCSNVHRDSMID